jgi:hypothetical protein
VLERHLSHPNLTAMGREAEQHGHGGHGHGQRQAYPPNPQLHAQAHGLVHTQSQPQLHPAAASVSPEHRRRNNVLAPGFLRPLTRADGTTIGRTHSVAALTSMTTSPTSDGVVPGSGASGASGASHASGVSQASGGSGASGASGSGASTGRYAHLGAAPMQRSNTEGMDSERSRQRRELHKRGDYTDQSYRFHGW